MEEKINTTAELGIFKDYIHKALYKDSDLKELLLGDLGGKSNTKIQTEFKEHVKSHLFIDDTIEETESFVFYDVIIPKLHPNIKYCRILMYLICHRDILDDYHKDGYYGNRADIMTQMVENIIINDEELVNKFGIGKINLDSVDIYNSNKFYGRMLTFEISNFRWKKD